MALSITALSDSGATASGGSASSAAFTSVNNSLLVAFVEVGIDTSSGNLSAASGWTAAGGGLTWTNQVSATDNHKGNWPTGCAIFTAPVTTGASTTLTVSGLGTTGTTYVRFRVNYATGYNTSTPTGATASNTNIGSGAISLTLSGAPAASSIVFAGIGDQNSNGTQTGITAGSGWTVLNAYEDLNSNFSIDASQYNTGTTSTNVPWQAACAGDTIWTQAAIALEIIAAAGGETITMDKWFQPPVHLPRRNEMVPY